MSTDTSIYTPAPNRDTLHVRSASQLTEVNSDSSLKYPTYKDLVKAELGWSASMFVP